MGEFVRDEIILAGEEFGSEFGMLEGLAGVRSGTGVFHAAGDEIIDHGLRVLFPGIVDAEFCAEEFDHLGSAGVVDGETVAAAFVRVVGDRYAAPRVFHLLKFAGHDRNEILGAGDGFSPRPGLHAVGGVGDVDELAVGDGNPIGGDGEDGFGGEAVVRIVVSRKVVARVLGFALRPDLFGAVGVVLVRQDEVEALGGPAFVANGDVEFFAGVRGGVERDDELVVFGLKFRGGFIYGDVLYGQTGGVENDFRGGLVENRERVRDFADDFFLIEIETQGDARVLQVVVAAASVGLIGTELYCG